MSSLSDSSNENEETSYFLKFVDKNENNEIDLDNEDLLHAQDQLLADQRQTEIEIEAEKERFDARTKVIIESSKLSLAPRILMAYTSFVTILLLSIIFNIYRLHKQFLAWVIAKNPQQGKKNVDSASYHCPQYICEWIQDMCEIAKDASLTTKDNGKDSMTTKKFGKGSSRPKKILDNSGIKDRAATYSHALKMRASTSYWFAYLCPMRCGQQEWLQVKLDGSFQGNPSLSPMVTRYMRALNKMKVNYSFITRIF